MASNDELVAPQNERLFMYLTAMVLLCLVVASTYYCTYKNPQAAQAELQAQQNDYQLRSQCIQTGGNPEVTGNEVKCWPRNVVITTNRDGNTVVYSVNQANSSTTVQTIAPQASPQSPPH